MNAAGWEIVPALGGGFLALRNGFQWGPDREQFDYSAGCSRQVFESFEAAEQAIAADDLRALGVELAAPVSLALGGVR